MGRRSKLLIKRGDDHGGIDVFPLAGQGAEFHQALHGGEPAGHIAGGVGAGGGVFGHPFRVGETRQDREVEVAEAAGGAGAGGVGREGAHGFDQSAEQAGVAPQGRHHAAPIVHVALPRVVERLLPVDDARGAEVAARPLLSDTSSSRPLKAGCTAGSPPESMAMISMKRPEMSPE
jgi:hypothetical protein